jgi:hypothetical protein
VILPDSALCRTEFFGGVGGANLRELLDCGDNHDDIFVIKGVHRMVNLRYYGCDAMVGWTSVMKRHWRRLARHVC